MDHEGPCCHNSNLSPASAEESLSIEAAMSLLLDTNGNYVGDVVQHYRGLQFVIIVVILSIVHRPLLTYPPPHHNCSHHHCRIILYRSTPVIVVSSSISYSSSLFDCCVIIICSVVVVGVAVEVHSCSIRLLFRISQQIVVCGDGLI